MPQQLTLIGCQFDVQDVPGPPTAPGGPPTPMKALILIEPQSGMQYHVLFDQSAWDQLVAKGNGSGRIAVAQSLPDPRALQQMDNLRRGA